LYLDRMNKDECKINLHKDSTNSLYLSANAIILANS
jgi:hypothetical protein